MKGQVCLDAGESADEWDLMGPGTMDEWDHDSPGAK